MAAISSGATEECDKGETCSEFTMVGTTEAVCRACGYPVVGLPTFICPECGVDFRKSGIRRAGQPRERSIVGPLVAAAATVCIAAVMFSSAISGMAYRIQMTRQADFGPLSNGQFSKGQVSSVQALAIIASCNGLYWKVPLSQDRYPSNDVAFDLTTIGNKRVKMSADARGNCTVAGGAARPLDASAVQAWLKAAGMDPSSAESRQLTDDVLASYVPTRDGRIDDISFANLGGRGGSSSGSYTHLTVATSLPWIIAGCAWIAIALMIRRERRTVGIGPTRCGRCRRGIEQMTDFSCPHCGADPRVAGIDTTERYLFAECLMPIAATGFTLLLVGGISSALLSGTLYEMHWSKNTGFQPSFNWGAQDPVQLIEIETSGAAVGLDHNITIGHRKPDRVAIRCQIMGHRASTIFPQTDGTFEECSANGLTIQHPLSSAEVVAWLQNAGLGTADHRALQLAPELIEASKLAWAGDAEKASFTGLRGGNGGSGASGGSAAWPSSLAWFFWLLAWVGIAVAIIGRAGHKRYLLSVMRNRSASPANAQPSPSC